MPRWSAVAAGRPRGGCRRGSRPGSPWPSRRCSPLWRPKDRAARRLPAVDREHGGRRGRVPLDREERHPRGGAARAPDCRGASDHRLSQRHQRGAGGQPRVAGMAPPGPEGRSALQIGIVLLGHVNRGGWGQKRDRHGYSGSRIGENEDEKPSPEAICRCESAQTSHVANGRRMRPPLCCRRRRGGLMLGGEEGCRGAAGDLDRSANLRIRAPGGTGRALRWHFGITVTGCDSAPADHDSFDR